MKYIDKIIDRIAVGMDPLKYGQSKLHGHQCVCGNDRISKLYTEK